MGITGKMMAFCGLPAAAALFFPPLLFGQAGPGPIAPPDSVYADPGPAPVPAPKPRVSQGKPTIVGTWRLNRDDSDDPRKKLQEAQQSNSGGSAGHGGGVHVGGYPGGGYPGGGYPGGGYPGGGGGGYGGHRQTSYSNDDLNHLSDVLNPARNVTIAKSDSLVQMNDDLDRKREFFTDGRKVDKSKNSKDDSYREAGAKWDDTRLVTQEDGPKGGKIERVLSPFDGENGPQLTETFKVIDTHGNTTAVIRLVYDRIEQPAESGKQ